MIKQISSVMLSVGTTGVALISIGTIISIIAGSLSIIYTTFKIYDWVKERRKGNK